jgi:hypothetical protein
MSRTADLGQPESHTNAAGIPDQIVNGLDGTGGQTSRGNAGQRILKRRGRSPRRRGAEKLQLAVSSSLPGALNEFLYSCADCIELETGPNGNQESPTRGSTLRPHP